MSPTKLRANLSKSFSSSTREQGVRFYQKNWVALHVRNSSSIEADVKERRLYRTKVSISPFIHDSTAELIASCNCSRFIQGEPCKHLWATILTCESQLLERLSGLRRVILDFDTNPLDCPDLQTGSKEDEHFLGRETAANQSNDNLRSLLASVSASKKPPTPLVGHFRFIVHLDELNPYDTPAFSVEHLRKGKIHSITKFNALRELGRAARIAGRSAEARILELLHHKLTIDASHRFELPAAELDQGLQELAKLGSLFSQQVGAAPVALTFDEGEPWLPELEIDALSDSPHMLLARLVLKRGDTTIDVSSTHPLTSSCFIHQATLSQMKNDSSSSQKLTKRFAKESMTPVTAQEISKLIEKFTKSAPNLPVIFKPSSGWKTTSTQPSVRLVFFGVPYGGKQTARVSFTYGDSPVSASSPASYVLDLTNHQVLLRDRVFEERMLQNIASLPEANIRSTTPFILEVSIAEIANVAQSASRLGVAVYLENSPVKAFTSVHFKAETSGIDWFDLTGTIRFDNTELTLPELLRQLDHSKGLVVLSDGSKGLLPEFWHKRLSLLAGFIKFQNGSLRLRTSQVSLLDAALGERVAVSYDNALKRTLGGLKATASLDAGEVPEGFRGELRPYQQEGLRWLSWLEMSQFGGCLADDMGLGKTIQVLAMLLRRQKTCSPKRPSLVIAPRSLITNWQLEAERFAPSLSLLDFSTADRHAKLADLSSTDVVLTTYAILRQDIELLAQIGFDWIILDEAQAIKNESSQVAKASRLLHGAHRLALSGTPVENHLGELRSIFEFLNPGLLPSGGKLSSLLRQGTKLDEEALALLRSTLQAFILRRSKTQVLRDLPSKTEQILYCDLSPRERKAYEDLRDYYRSVLLQKKSTKLPSQGKIDVLAALLRLRQAATHQGLIDLNQKESTKLDLVTDRLLDLRASGQKALVFSQFTSLLALLKERLKDAKIPYAYLDGATRDRQAQVEAFQTDANCTAFLLSLKAGGVGLNLTAASYCFIIDPWWNPAAESQAIDRCYRIGQTQPVTAYRIIARDTVEEKILALQAQKKLLGESVISSEESVIRALTVDELTMLLA